MTDFRDVKLPAVKVSLNEGARWGEELNETGGKWKVVSMIHKDGRGIRRHETQVSAADEKSAKQKVHGPLKQSGHTIQSSYTIPLDENIKVFRGAPSDKPKKTDKAKSIGSAKAYDADLIRPRKKSQEVDEGVNPFKGVYRSITGQGSGMSPRSVAGKLNVGDRFVKNGEYSAAIGRLIGEPELGARVNKRKSKAAARMYDAALTKNRRTVKEAVNPFKAVLRGMTGRGSGMIPSSNGKRAVVGMKLSNKANDRSLDSLNKYNDARTRASKDFPDVKNKAQATLYKNRILAATRQRMADIAKNELAKDRAYILKNPYPYKTYTTGEVKESKLLPTLGRALSGRGSGMIPKKTEFKKILGQKLQDRNEVARKERMRVSGDRHAEYRKSLGPLKTRREKLDALARLAGIAAKDAHGILQGFNRDAHSMNLKYPESDRWDTNHFKKKSS